jgi:hypothetical protein
MTPQSRNAWRIRHGLACLIMIGGLALTGSGWTQAGERTSSPLPPLITAASVHGPAAARIKLRILAPVNVNGKGTLLLLSGIPAGAKLDTGINVGDGGWLLAPERARDATISALPGAFVLEARLLTEDMRDASQPVSFKLTVFEPDAPFWR